MIVKYRVLKCNMKRQLIKGSARLKIPDNVSSKVEVKSSDVRHIGYGRNGLDR